MSFCERTIPLFLYLVVSYLVCVTIHLRKASIPMDASDADKRLAKVMFEPVSPWLFPMLFAAGAAVSLPYAGLSIVTLAVGAFGAAIVWVLLSLVHLMGAAHGAAPADGSTRSTTALDAHRESKMLMLEDHSKR